MKFENKTYNSSIRAIWLNITQSCNNKCGYCYDAGNDNFNMQSGTFLEIAKLLKPLKIRNLILIGGEPTLHPSFIDFANKCNEISKRITVITNGTRLVDVDFCKQIEESPISDILFSLLGHNAALHDAGTLRAGSFQQLIDGANNIKNLNRKINVVPITTITNSNKTYLREILDLSVSLGFKKAVYNVCVPSMASIKGELCVEPSEIATLIEHLFAYSKSKDISIQIGTSLPKCIFKSDVFEEMFAKKALMVSPCQVFTGGGYQFLSDGSITPCTHLYDCKLINPIELKFTPEKFVDWLNGESAKKQRESLWNYPSVKCKSCDSWGACVGGCPTLWSKFDSNMYLRGCRKSS